MIVELKKDFLGKKAGERVAVPLTDAEDLVGEGIARPVHDDPLLPLIAEHVTAAVDKALAQPRRRGSVPFPGGHDHAAGFKNFGEFALAVRDACEVGNRPDDRAERDRQPRGLSVSRVQCPTPAPVPNTRHPITIVDLPPGQRDQCAHSRRRPWRSASRRRPSGRPSGR